jgi:hypothetical protein
MAEDRPVSLYQQQQEECLSLQSSFKFHCHSGLACFNQCCQRPTVSLSPYDLLRLKNFLGLASGEFLQRYTLPGTEEWSNFPLVFLDAYSSPEGGCPFVGAWGCTVYEHRPAACRLFPVTMGSRLTARGLEDYYFCRRLDYCRGFAGEAEWTVASWQANQGFAEFDQGRREWLEILLQAGQQEPVKPQVRDLAAVIAYDADQFRRMISAPAFPRPQDLDGQAWDELRENDLALLKFAYRFLKSILFAEDAGLLKAASRSLYFPGRQD